MKKKRWVRFLGIGIIFFALLFNLSPDVMAKKNTETIRVGLYKKDGYHMIDDMGTHSGYDYDYLMRIADFTGWKYEFTEGTWDECLNMLENGEIDLLGAVEKNSERLNTLHFSTMPSMYSTGCLLQMEGCGDYTYEDFEAFDGMRVGALAGAPRSDKLIDYSKENNFTYTMEYFSSEEALQEALRNGEIDCIYLSNNHNLSSYRIVARFGFSPLYYVTSPARSDLIPALNNALRLLHSQDVYFDNMLQEKYFHSSFQVAFTKEEKAYMTRVQKIPVALYMGYGDLFCRYDKKEDRYEGIAIDILELLSERTGIQFEYHEAPLDIPPWEYLVEHPNTIAAPFFQNNVIKQPEALRLLDPLVRGNMIAVFRHGETAAMDEDILLAVPVGEYRDEEKFRQYFPKAQVISCATHEEGLELLLEKKVDMALINEVNTAYLLKSPFYRDMQTTRLSLITEDMVLALGDTSDERLITILNKGIDSFNVQDIHQIIVDNTAEPYKLSPWEWLYNNRHHVIICGIILLGLAFIHWKGDEQRKCRNEYKQNLQLAEERYKTGLEYREKMFRQANYDTLTGLYNGRYFLEKANERLRAEPDVVYTFLRINIKQFKMINELYGSEAGNGVLLKVADHLRIASRGKGIYGRMYADHFTLCMELSQEELDRISKDCVWVMDYNGHAIRVQFAIGVYIDSRHCMNAQQAMSYALIALQNGSGHASTHLYYFKDSYLQSMLTSQRITNEMEQALAEEQYKIYLQPQYDISSGKLVGAEALVRWQHPEAGMISPGRFIQVFEANGFIYQLDSYMCEKVCRLLAEWMKQGKLVPVSFNLSRVDLERPDLIPMLCGNLEKYNIPIQYLHLEITESAYVEDQQNTQHTIEQLREIGFCLEMDDFGSGYSSLNMLKDVPVDILKMDMQFFDGERNMDKGGNIIEAIVNLAHSLGIIVIAEGVETEREANFLRSVNCSLVQGYLYGHPMPIEDFEKLLASNEVGKKSIRLNTDDSTNNLYWKMEKYDILLFDEQIMLLDYDPFRDYAVFTYLNRSGKRMETAMLNYTEWLEDHPHVYPTYRAALIEILQGNDLETQEMDIQADFFGTGTYEWFHLVVHHYKQSAERIRTIATIKKIKKIL